jgi:RNA polymerase-binding transcription factor DksA
MKMIDSLGYGAAKASTFDVLSTLDRSCNSSLGRWHWHYRALIKLRERLLRHRAELAVAVMESPESWDIADAANADFEHDVVLSRLSAEQDTLFEIEAALSRIRAGTYGLCEATGQPIPGARLRAIPWARFRQEAEEQLERQGVCRPPHLGELKSVHAQISFDRPSEFESDNESEETL